MLKDTLTLFAGLNPLMLAANIKRVHNERVTTTQYQEDTEFFQPGEISHDARVLYGR